MKEAYSRLRSNLPERRASSTGALGSNPRAVRAWLETLPTANAVAAASRMRDDLADLNRQRADGLQRLEALETLRPSMVSLAAGLDRQVLGASFPLPPQKEEMAALALALQGEFACGYRTALVEITGPNGAVPLLRGKSVALAAARALQHGGEHLAMAYRHYRTPPRGAWQALHDTYRFAADLGLDDRAIADPLQSTTETSRELYAHALLVALANPYRHTQREQGEVMALARALIPHVQLRAHRGDERDVLIDADKDRGPGYIPEERDGAGSAALALNLGALCEVVSSVLAATPSGAGTAVVRQRGGSALHLDAQLVHRVGASWTAHGARAQPRLAGGYKLDTVLGLNDLHYALAGDEDFENFIHRVQGEGISLSDNPLGASWRAATQKAGRGVRLSARVLDQGLGGYRLEWERGASVRARVADLVGLSLPTQHGETADWMVGVIRWLRVNEDGLVDAGVELLARRALPVGVQVAGISRTSLRGLLLAPLAMDTGVDYPALLVSTEIDRATRELELSVPADLQGMPTPARRLHASGLRLRETTGIYHHFALAPPADAVGEALGSADILSAGA